MILYSIIPAEVVFARESNSKEYQTFTMDYMGEKVEVMPSSGNAYTIVRLISTSPRAYLNPGLQPGMTIKCI